ILLTDPAHTYTDQQRDSHERYHRAPYDDCRYTSRGLRKKKYGHQYSIYQDHRSPPEKDRRDKADQAYEQRSRQRSLVLQLIETKPYYQRDRRYQHFAPRIKETAQRQPYDRDRKYSQDSCRYHSLPFHEQRRDEPVQAY